MTEPGRLNTQRSRTAVKAPPREVRHYYVAFGLGREAFAVEIRFVKEILQFQELTEVPLLPSWVRGLINLRGAVVPVLDLSIRFGRPPTEVARRACIVILEVPQGERLIPVGVIVDRVTEVLDLGASDLEPAPSLGTDPRSEFLCGIAKVKNQFVILLDVAHLLSAEEVAVLARDVLPEGPEA